MLDYTKRSVRAILSRGDSVKFFKVTYNKDGKKEKTYKLSFGDSALTLERTFGGRISIDYKDIDFVMFGADGENTMSVSRKQDESITINIGDNRQDIMQCLISRNIKVAVV